jgi:hypothetical protein
MLRPEELACETPEELTCAIQTREAEMVAVEAQLRENAAAVGVATDVARRSALKRSGSDLAEALSDVRAIISRLRAARRQALDDARLIARGGVPFGPLWPELRGERPSRRARSRGIK